MCPVPSLNYVKVQTIWGLIPGLYCVIAPMSGHISVNYQVLRIYLWMLFQLLVPYLLQREPKLIFAQRFDRFSLHCVNHLRSPFLLHLQHAWITSKWNSTLCWALWCVSPAPRSEACFLNHWFLLITYSFIFPIYFFCSVCSQPHSTTLHITSL